MILPLSNLTPFLSCCATPFTNSWLTIAINLLHLHTCYHSVTDELSHHLSKLPIINSISHYKYSSHTSKITTSYGFICNLKFPLQYSSLPQLITDVANQNQRYLELLSLPKKQLSAHFTVKAATSALSLFLQISYQLEIKFHLNLRLQIINGLQSENAKWTAPQPLALSKKCLPRTTRNSTSKTHTCTFLYQMQNH